MTMDAVGENFWGAKLVENGWRTLKGGAHRALTYFAPKQGDSEESTTQRWGLLATEPAAQCSGAFDAVAGGRYGIQPGLVGLVHLVAAAGAGAAGPRLDPSQRRVGERHAFA
ncbi:MAG: hypothetical protein AAGG11_11595 [Pseudomonadota bacterium]